MYTPRNPWFRCWVASFKFKSRRCWRHHQTKEWSPEENTQYCLMSWKDCVSSAVLSIVHSLNMFSVRSLIKKEGPPVKGVQMLSFPVCNCSATNMAELAATSVTLANLYQSCSRSSCIFGNVGARFGQGRCMWIKKDYISGSATSILVIFVNCPLKVQQYYRSAMLNWSS